jgi:hypothetical protein
LPAGAVDDPPCVVARDDRRPPASTNMVARMPPPSRRLRLPRRTIIGLAALAALVAAAGSCSCSDPDPAATSSAPGSSPSGSTDRPPATDPPVVAVPTAIRADCSVDVSAELNRWLASVPDGATATFAGGCYRIDQTIALVDRSSLTIEGGGATFQTSEATGDASSLAAPSKASRTRDHWLLTRGRDVSLRNLTIRGANPVAGQGEAAYVAALEAQHGIDIAGTQSVDIDHVTITDVYGDFIYFGPDSTGSATVFSGGRVHDSHFERNGRQGIAITGGHGIQIDHNVITNTRRATFDLEPNKGTGWGVEDVVIEHNEVGSGRLNLVSMAGSGPVHRVRISDNTLHRSLSVDARGPGDGTRSSLTVSDNVSDASWGTSGTTGAVAVQGFADVTVTGNTQPMQAGRGNVGVSLRQVTGGRVTANRFPDAGAATFVGPDSVGVTSCGNQVVADGPFDRDEPCPPGSPAGSAPDG